MADMSPRERVTRVVNRQKPDRVPAEAGFTPTIREKFEKATGQTDAAEYFHYDTRAVGFKPPTVKPDFSAYFPDAPEELTVNEWGMATVPAGFLHFTGRRYALQNATSVKEVQDFPWPDFTDPARHEHLEADVAALHDEGWFVTGMVGHIFETAWQVRGNHEFFMDTIDHPDIAHAICDALADRQAFRARRFAEAGVDMLQLGDDVGMQDRLMMSPETWRRLLKPQLARVIQAAREVNPTLPVWYHSDGDIRQIIPELIEVGVTVLNPVQPECMDPIQIKKQYGDRLAFWGTIGTQSTMPFGSVDDVRACVRERIETVGYDGGLMLAPTHVLEPEVPWENIAAFFDAVKEFGRYA